MNITVYLGSSAGNVPYLCAAAAELGGFIADSGDTLIYGGSKSGLMGVLAESALGRGGKVIGIEPQVFIDAGYLYDAVTELIVSKNMIERTTKMIDMGDAFIAFPGGYGGLLFRGAVLLLRGLACPGGALFRRGGGRKRSS